MNFLALHGHGDKDGQDVPLRTALLGTWDRSVSRLGYCTMENEECNSQQKISTVQHSPNDVAAEMPARARLAVRPVAFGVRRLQVCAPNKRRDLGNILRMKTSPSRWHTVCFT